MSQKKKLIIDPWTLFEEKKFKKNITNPIFSTNLISSLIDFKKHFYNLYIITGINIEQKLLSWGKQFLIQEDITFSTISLTNVKKLFAESTISSNSIILYALSPILSHNFIPIKNKTKSSVVFFIQSPILNGKPQFLTSKNWAAFKQDILYPLRQAQIHRKTKETDIKIRLNLDGIGTAKIKTGLGFLDHMLTNFCKHSGIDIVLTVQGDLEVDEHHTIEDTALVLGEGIRKALGDKKGLERYSFVLPMDESEASCSVDFSGRSHLEWNALPFKREYVGDFPTEMLKHFYSSFCLAAGLNMNMKIIGENEHHLIESSFKSFARCLRQALKVTGAEIPSTKGLL